MFCDGFWHSREGLSFEGLVLCRGSVGKGLKLL